MSFDLERILEKQTEENPIENRTAFGRRNEYAQVTMNDEPRPGASQHVEIHTDGACEPNPGRGNQVGDWLPADLHRLARAAMATLERNRHGLFIPPLKRFHPAPQAI
ncbi:MAG: hypothetical protein ACR2OZ_03625 [Verrucomicrobiales bacterium]